MGPQVKQGLTLSKAHGTRSSQLWLSERENEPLMNGGNQTEGPLWSLYVQLKSNGEKRTVTKQGSRSKGWELRERGGCGEVRKHHPFHPESL